MLLKLIAVGSGEARPSDGWWMFGSTLIGTVDDIDLRVRWSAASAQGVEANGQSVNNFGRGEVQNESMCGIRNADRAWFMQSSSWLFCRVAQKRRWPVQGTRHTAPNRTEPTDRPTERVPPPPPPPPPSPRRRPGSNCGVLVIVVGPCSLLVALRGRPLST